MENPNARSEIEKEPSIDFVDQTLEYFYDAGQRMILFSEALRKRGNNYFDHIKKGQPPVLVFNYEIILDAREFEKPVNYALARIIDRRSKTKDSKAEKERRDAAHLKSDVSRREEKRPIMIIDPRAGHGPGIGGSKENSEIGMALIQGHEVYFVFFFPEPIPGQTLADVKNAEVAFLEEIKKRHPKAPKPAVIGNCQGGWAAALIGADRPDLVGPLLLNGSPLSYWSGVDGKNPMRYKGGLLGGAWTVSLMNDLGKGKFDGANLVMGMEELNPANTYWKKLYNVYANIDEEEERFLAFEKWWGGFFYLSAEEIHQIVSDLFIGNKLILGTFELDKGKITDFKKFKDPIVVFASEGDNITPPQQALNWIPKIYQSVDEIKRYKQVIVYIVHPTIGHLGIFVAGSIAKKEQKEIIGSIEMIDHLSPGLYEMVITKEPSKPWANDYHVKFEERDIKDILAYDDGFENEKEFEYVARFSELNDAIYQAFFGSWVKLLSTQQSAEAIRQMHPLRTQRYLLSDLNPFLLPIKQVAPLVKADRKKVDENNFFLKMEQIWSDSIETSLNTYRDIRDAFQESTFKFMYDNPFMEALFSDPAISKAKEKKEQKQRIVENSIDKQIWLDAMEKGGFPEAAIRIMLAVLKSDKIVDEDEMRVANQIIKSHKKLSKLLKSDIKRITMEQSRILQTDEAMALKSLPKLIKSKADRADACKLAETIANSDSNDLGPKEKRILQTIKDVLEI
ncbi:DUF3141 domain-containing protein [bacterium]|nr:DUF3141 domain-containing protein [bacterium]